MFDNTLNFPLITPEFIQELKEKPSTLTDELPLGVYMDGRLYKKFQIVDSLSVAALTHIHNKTMLQNNPARWFALTVSYLLDNVEGIPIYKEFLANNYKIIPNIVLHFSNFDALYVIIYAHNEFFGSEVTFNEYTCVRCKHVDTYTLYVDKFYVDRREVQFPIEIQLEKPIGNFRMQSSGSDIIPPGIEFDRVYITPPNLKTSIKHKDLYKASSDNNEAYNLAIRLDHMTIGNSEGLVLDEKAMFFIRNELWNKISPKDQLRIHRTFEDLPKLYPIMRADCANCGSRVLVSLNFFSLIPQTV